MARYYRPRRKLYIPITRSGSSILASILTQLLDEARKKRHNDLVTKVERGEISEGERFFREHYVWVIWAICVFVLLVTAMCRAVTGT